MKKRPIYILAITFFLSMGIIGTASAQDSLDYNVPKSFVVVKMTKDYTEALKFAKEASHKLHLKLDLRDLSPNAVTGLTLPEDICDSNDWSYPTNFPRGRYDDSNYVSIEWSSDFYGMKHGYYAVMTASSYASEHWIDSSLVAARKVYPAAFIEHSKVYMGCIH